MRQPTNERIEAYFDKHARGYDREMGFFERFVLGHQRHWAVAQAVPQRRSGSDSEPRFVRSATPG